MLRTTTKTVTKHQIVFQWLAISPQFDETIIEGVAKKTILIPMFIVPISELNTDNKVYGEFLTTTETNKYHIE